MVMTEAVCVECVGQEKERNGNEGTEYSGCH